MTLNPALKTSLTHASTPPAGYSQSIEILASGATPGLLAPGESVRVPVYTVGLNVAAFLAVVPPLPTFSLKTLRRR